jgi:hypothetical protein
MKLGNLFKKSKQTSSVQGKTNSSNVLDDAFISDPLMQKSSQTTSSKKSTLSNPLIPSSTMAMKGTFAYAPTSFFHASSGPIPSSGQETPSPSSKTSGVTSGGFVVDQSIIDKTIGIKNTAVDPIPPSGPSSGPSGSNTPPKEAVYYPTLPEFVALLHHQIQQVIEHLAQPDLHKRSTNAPSQAFVKIESMNIDIPVTLMPRIVNFGDNVDVSGFKVLEQPFFIPGSKNMLYMRVGVLNPNTAQTTTQGAVIRVGFSVAAK